MGQKSQTYIQIVLETDLNGSSTAYEPEKVISEGEKRAVAFADFMTEVALDDTSTGIVLDNPVTSLDLEWRDTIASLLVSEARNRQVIIFTHDLSFLYFLKNYAEKNQIDVITHWIKCGDTDKKPGYVFLNSSPALEREYRKAKKAREMYEEAKKADAVTQENLLRQGFGPLRSSYEALIIFDLFNEVIMRFDERISFGRLRGIVWDNKIVNEIIERCEMLSRYIEGHLHGDVSIASKPTCELLCEEIQFFDNIKKRIKNLKREM